MMKQRWTLLMLGILLFLGPVPSGFAVRPGSYQAAAVDEDARKAADFALGEEAKRSGEGIQLKAILEANKQIVAGMNYRLVLSVTSEGREKKARVTIFRALDGHYELKSWDWIS